MFTKSLKSYVTHEPLQAQFQTAEKSNFPKRQNMDPALQSLH